MKTNALILILILTVTGCKKGASPTQKIENTEKTNLTVSEDTIPTLPKEVKKEEEPAEEKPAIQLIIKKELTEADLYVDYDGGNQLADYFLIEVIDKNTFETNRSLSVNKLSTDTTNVHKENNTLSLPSAKGTISFTDNLSDNEDHKEYTYVGCIESLNVYVLSGIYWEDWNYFFVDKTTGNTVQSFINYPHLSGDGKHIISLDFDTFEGVTYIELYDITDNKYIDPIIGMYAKRWIPIKTSEPPYWGSDNFLYIPVIHNSDYWIADGDYSGLRQYIRLKPIES